MMLKTNYIFSILILVLQRTLCQDQFKLQMYKRAVELQRSNSFSIFDQSSSSSNHNLLDKEQLQRHKPSFSTSSWPPELPKSFRIKKYNLPKVECEEDKKKIKKNNKKSNGVSRHSSTKNQYEHNKGFHAITQTIMQDNRWERMGKIVGTAVGYGVIRAYDKCKAAFGNVQNKCAAVYDHVRRRL